MKKADVKIGQVYRAQVSGKPAEVKIVSESPYGGWNALNVATLRAVRIRSSQRLRGLVVVDRLEQIRNLRRGGATFEDARATVVKRDQELRDAAQDLKERAQAEEGYSSLPGAAEDARTSEAEWRRNQ